MLRLCFRMAMVLSHVMGNDVDDDDVTALANLGPFLYTRPHILLIRSHTPLLPENEKLENKT